MEQNRKHSVLGLKYYKIYVDSQDLEFQTANAACFDVSSYLRVGEDRPNFIKGYDKDNHKIDIIIHKDIFNTYSEDKDNGFVLIQPQERVLIPSGIILDIPNGYSVRTHPRSSTGYKIGLTHPHGEGIIDSDYFNELFLLFINLTGVEVLITHNQRISQAEMIKNEIYSLSESKIKPSQKTNRVGGLGSTG